MCSGKSLYLTHKAMCSNIKKSPNEGLAKFGARTLAERHKLFSEYFKEYPRFSHSQYEFNHFSKVIDERVRKWSNKEDNEMYLSIFSWASGVKGRT